MGTTPFQKPNPAFAPKDKYAETEKPQTTFSKPSQPAGSEPSSFASKQPTAQKPSPFAAQKPSPFAQAQQKPSPFAQTQPKPSPFAQAQPKPSPFAAQKPSPFAQAQPKPSPFTQAQQKPSPFAQQPGATLNPKAPGQQSAFAQKPAQSPLQPKTLTPPTSRPPLRTPQPASQQKPLTSPRPFFHNTPPSGQVKSPFRGQSSFGVNSAFAPTKDVSVTNEEFILLRDFIYKKCGIFIAEARKYLIENRLSSRLKALNLKNYTEYYKYLKFDDNKESELNELYVLMTTNETSFFRNPPQLKVFQDIVLTKLVNAIKKTGQRRLRIWSAGCSTGEEPYTLAIIVAEVLKGDLASWDVKITANDLSTQVLAAARQGIYSEYALRTTPKDLIPKYFTKDGQVYKINTDMKRLISFGQINLNEREQLRKVESSHIVFCRNVIIYFDDDMKRRVINAFYDNLLPGGALLIGHSETLHNITRSFDLEHYTGTIVYRKRS